MSAIATTLINWSELWKITLSALVAGTAVVHVLGLMLLGISRGKTVTTPATRYGLYTLSAVCGLVIVAVAAVGIYAMTQKPVAPKPKPEAAAAMVAPGTATQQRPGSRELGPR